MIVTPTPSVEVVPSATPTPSPLPSPTVLPEIVVRDQQSNGYYAVIDKVSVPEDGWLVVYLLQDQKGPQIVGRTPIRAGVTEEIPVLFDQKIRHGSRMGAVLHADTGQIGEFDFPPGDLPFQTGGTNVGGQFVLEVPTPQGNELSVRDNQVIDDSVTVDRVTVVDPSWLVLYAVDSQGAGPIVVGNRLLQPGTYSKLSIPLERKLDRTTSLTAVLHEDLGTEGVFDFPVDDPIVRMPTGVIVSASFNALVDSWSIRVNDQEVSTNRMTVDEVSAPQDAWVVIYEDSSGAPGGICGYIQVGPGVTSNLSVELNTPAIVSGRYWAALHMDLGVDGQFEPSTDDLFAESGGERIMTPFGVLVVGAAMPTTGADLSGRP